MTARRSLLPPVGLSVVPSVLVSVPPYRPPTSFLAPPIHPPLRHPVHSFLGLLPVLFFLPTVHAQPLTRTARGFSWLNHLQMAMDIYLGCWRQRRPWRWLRVPHGLICSCVWSLPDTTDDGDDVVIEPGNNTNENTGGVIRSAVVLVPFPGYRQHTILPQEGSLREVVERGGRCNIIK